MRLSEEDYKKYHESLRDILGLKDKDVIHFKGDCYFRLKDLRELYKHIKLGLTPEDDDIANLLGSIPVHPKDLTASGRPQEKDLLFILKDTGAADNGIIVQVGRPIVEKSGSIAQYQLAKKSSEIESFMIFSKKLDKGVPSRSEEASKPEFKTPPDDSPTSTKRTL